MRNILWLERKRERERERRILIEFFRLVLVGRIVVHAEFYLERKKDGLRG